MMDGMQNWPIEVIQFIQKLEQENKELTQRITALEEENRKLRELVQKLEARLKAYENPHTPPSKQRFKRNQGGSSSGKRGAPKGHNGATREQPLPTRTELHRLGRCPRCGGTIIKLSEMLKRIIEEIPELQPVEVTEHLIETGVCEHCGTIVAESDLPEEGDFGKNVLAHVTLMRFEDRLPIRKVVVSLKRQHNITLTHTTVLDITRRVSDKLRGKYEQITEEIRQSSYVHVDQTEIKVNGVPYQLWVFVAQLCTLFIIRKAGYMDVMETVLGKRYRGIIIGDGLETYRQYTDRIQRCWSHLLRESADLAEKHESAKLIHEGLKILFEKVNSVTYEDPPDERQQLYDECIAEMNQWIDYAVSYKELRKFAVTLSNGLQHWFTRILYPFVDATNNVAERALREFVVLRKIIGTLRNKKGTEIAETILTMIATWKQRGLTTFPMMKASI